MKKLQPYFAFFMLIVFTVSSLPYQVWQENEYLQHVQALQTHDIKHHCEFDQLHCQAQLLKHTCQHSAHIAVEINSKQQVFFQLSAATISKIGVQFPLFFKNSDLFKALVSDAQTLHLASVLLRGPPVL